MICKCNFFIHEQIQTCVSKGNILVVPPFEEKRYICITLSVRLSISPSQKLNIKYYLT